MNLPEEMLAAIEAATNANPENVGAATEQALAAIRSMSSFASVTEQLLYDAVKLKVHDCRHKVNVMIKRDAGKYGGPAKVKSGSSKSVGAAAWSVYDIRMGGKTLGNLTGTDLKGIANIRREAIGGLEFDVKLCEWLESQGVTGDKTVRDVVPAMALAQAMERLKSAVPA